MSKAIKFIHLYDEVAKCEAKCVSMKCYYLLLNAIEALQLADQSVLPNYK